MLVWSNKTNDAVFGKNKTSFGDRLHATAEDQDEDSSQVDPSAMSKEIYDTIKRTAKEPTVQLSLTLKQWDDTTVLAVLAHHDYAQEYDRWCQLHHNLKHPPTDDYKSIVTTKDSDKCKLLAHLHQFQDFRSFMDNNFRHG